MIKRFCVFFVILLSSVFVSAQIPAGFVQVTATVPALASGSFSANWTNISSQSQLPLLGGVSSFQQTVVGNFDSNGHISTLLADPAQVLPTPSNWSFSLSYVCPGASNGAYKVSISTPITGGGGTTQDISPQLISAFPVTACGGAPVGAFVTLATNQTITGQKTFTQPVILPIGTPTGNQAVSANALNSGNLSASFSSLTIPSFSSLAISSLTIGSNCPTASSGLNSVNTNGILNAACFLGADIGAKINAAYAACASTGCIIQVPPGTYSFSTPVQIATLGYQAFIQCSSSSTVLNWTPTSGVAFQFASTGTGWGQGIRDCRITGPLTGSATAIQFGVSSSDVTGRTAQGTKVSNLQINGFNTQLDYESQAWNIVVEDSKFEDPITYQVFYNGTSINSGEKLIFRGDTFDRDDGVWQANGVYLNNAAGYTHITSSNFDNTELTLASGTMYCDYCYFENPGPPVSPTRTTPWINVSGLMQANYLQLIDNSNVSATQPAISVNGSLTWVGGQIAGCCVGKSPAGEVVNMVNSLAYFWAGGDIQNNTSSAFFNHGSSTQNYTSLQNSRPVFGSRFVQLKTPDTGFHYINYQNDTATNDVFIQQDTDALNNEFQIIMGYNTGSNFNTPLRIDHTGSFMALGPGVVDSNFNQHIYGTTKIDRLTVPQIIPVAGATNYQEGPRISSANDGDSLISLNADPAVSFGTRAGQWTILDESSADSTLALQNALTFTANGQGGGGFTSNSCSGCDNIVSSVFGVQNLSSATATALCVNTAGPSTINNVLSACTSLRKYKENIVSLRSSLAEIAKLRPVSFTSKIDTRLDSKTGKRKALKEYGFIAEEVNAVDAKLSTYDKNGDLVGVAYSTGIVALLTKAVQEQQEQIHTLELRIKKLENKK